jgi:hypothetical protein
MIVVGLGPTNNTNSTGGDASAFGEGTGVFKGQTNSSNALGHVGPTDFSISSPPYKVKSCDQVLLIPGKRILDFNDYCKKQDGFFTMSIYMVNSFEAKDSNKLVDSITMDKMTKLPTHLVGAPGCVDFRGSSNRIAICLDNPELVDQIIKAYSDFLSCRRGESLKEYSSEDIREIRQMKDYLLHELAVCRGNTTSPYTGPMPNSNSTLPLPAPLPSLAGSSSSSASSKINPVYSDLKVPGS